MTSDDRPSQIAWLMGLTAERVLQLRAAYADYVGVVQDDHRDAHDDSAAEHVGLDPRWFRHWRRLERLDDRSLQAAVDALREEMSSRRRHPSGRRQLERTENPVRRLPAR